MIKRQINFFKGKNRKQKIDPSSLKSQIMAIELGFQNYNAAERECFTDHEKELQNDIGKFEV